MLRTYFCKIKIEKVLWKNYLRIPLKKAVSLMNFVTEFPDKTKNKPASGEYANISKNPFFLRLFGGRIYKMKGFFPDVETDMIRNGLIILYDNDLEPLVDGASYRDLLAKVQINKKIKLTYPEEIFLFTAQEHSTRQGSDPYDMHTPGVKDAYTSGGVYMPTRFIPRPTITVGAFLTSPGVWILSFLLWLLAVARFKKKGSLEKEMIERAILLDSIRTNYLKGVIDHAEASDRLSINFEFCDRQIQAILEPESLSFPSLLPKPPPPPPKPKRQREISGLGFLISAFGGFSFLISALNTLS